MADRPEVGLAMMDGIVADGTLDTYPYLHAARADMLRRLERWTEAAAAYDRALELTSNGAERAVPRGSSAGGRRERDEAPAAVGDRQAPRTRKTRTSFDAASSRSSIVGTM